MLTDENIKKFELIKQIIDKHDDYLKIYQDIISSSKKVLMSKNKRTSLYGMFSPNDFIEVYEGKLTNDVKKRHFTYYFDDKERVLLTERYDDERDRNLLSLIFYFYYEDYTEIIRYDWKNNEVNTVEFIVYKEGKRVKYFESSMIRDKKCRGYREIDYEYINDLINITINKCFIWYDGTVENKVIKESRPLKNL